MSWVKLDDGFADHPKVTELSDAAFRMHVTALCWCGRHETDGEIREKAARTMGPHRLIDELTDARLWETTDAGFRIRDYLKYNPSHEQLEAKRDATRLRLQRLRGAECNGVTSHDNDDTDAGGNDVANTTPGPLPLSDHPNRSEDGSARDGPDLEQPTNKGSGRARPAKMPRKILFPLPTPFPVSEKHLEYAAKKTWPEAWLRDRHEHFCELAQAKGWSYVDWDLALYTFLRNEISYGRGPKGAAQPFRGPVQPSHGRTGFEDT